MLISSAQRPLSLQTARAIKNPGLTRHVCSAAAEPRAAWVMERGKCARISNRLAQWVHSNPDVFDPEGVLTAGEILIRLPKDLQEHFRQLETEAVKEGAAEAVEASLLHLRQRELLRQREPNTLHTDIMSVRVMTWRPAGKPRLWRLWPPGTKQPRLRELSDRAASDRLYSQQERTRHLARTFGINSGAPPRRQWHVRWWEHTSVSAFDDVALHISASEAGRLRALCATEAPDACVRLGVISGAASAASSASASEEAAASFPQIQWGPAAQKMLRRTFERGVGGGAIMFEALALETIRRLCFEELHYLKCDVDLDGDADLLLLSRRDAKIYRRDAKLRDAKLGDAKAVVRRPAMQQHFGIDVFQAVGDYDRSTGEFARPDAAAIGRLLARKAKKALAVAARRNWQPVLWAWASDEACADDLCAVHAKLVGTPVALIVALTDLPMKVPNKFGRPTTGVLEPE